MKINKTWPDIFDQGYQFQLEPSSKVQKKQHRWIDKRYLSMRHIWHDVENQHENQQQLYNENTSIFALKLN